MKIFVTGAAGFVGRHLCRRLRREGQDVVAYAGRLDSDSGLKSQLLGIEVLYHLATCDSAATQKLVAAAGDAGVAKFIFSSTSAVYGAAALKPTPETYGPLIPLSPYATGKLASEAEISAGALRWGFESLILRFANLVGPDHTHGVILDFVRRLRVEPALLQVRGNGSQRKSYLHIEEALNALSVAHEAHGIFNVTGLGTTDVRFIAEEACRQFAPTAQISYELEDRGFPGEVPDTLMDGSALARRGWSAQIPSDQAVVRALQEAR